MSNSRKGVGYLDRVLTRQWSNWLACARAKQSPYVLTSSVHAILQLPTYYANIYPNRILGSLLTNFLQHNKAIKRKPLKLRRKCIISHPWNHEDSYTQICCL